MEGRLEMFGPRRFAGQKRKHDSSAEGEAKGNSQFWFQSQSIAVFSLPKDVLAHNTKKIQTKRRNMCLLVPPLRKAKQKKKKKRGVFPHFIMYLP